MLEWFILTSAFPENKSRGNLRAADTEIAFWNISPMVSFATLPWTKEVVAMVHPSRARADKGFIVNV
jgi:hypothetical protein|tara:strand:+ start:4035 stop:4235 length:201 start_codon:yes stop_codon:yes gene_type:complete